MSRIAAFREDAMGRGVRQSVKAVVDEWRVVLRSSHTPCQGDAGFRRRAGHSEGECSLSLWQRRDALMGWR